MGGVQGGLPAMVVRVSVLKKYRYMCLIND